MLLRWLVGSSHLTHPPKPRPKTPDVMDMDGVVAWLHLSLKFWSEICRMVSLSIYCGNLDTHWIQAFLRQQTPTCFLIEKTLLLPHLKQVYNEFSKVSCGFPSSLIKRFIFSLAESKTRCSKIRSIFLLICFPYALKQTWTKQNKFPHRFCVK